MINSFSLSKLDFILTQISFIAMCIDNEQFDLLSEFKKQENLISNLKYLKQLLKYLK